MTDQELLQSLEYFERQAKNESDPMMAEVARLKADQLRQQAKERGLLKEEGNARDN